MSNFYRMKFHFIKFNLYFIEWKQKKAMKTERKKKPTKKLLVFTSMFHEFMTIASTLDLGSISNNSLIHSTHRRLSHIRSWRFSPHTVNAYKCNYLLRLYVIHSRIKSNQIEIETLNKFQVKTNTVVCINTKF